MTKRRWPAALAAVGLLAGAATAGKTTLGTDLSYAVFAAGVAAGAQPEKKKPQRGGRR